MSALFLLMLFGWANGFWLGRVTRARFWPWVGRRIRGYFARTAAAGAVSRALATSRSTSTSG